MPKTLAVKVGSVHKNALALSVRSNGVYKQAIDAWVKDAGTYKPFLSNKSGTWEFTVLPPIPDVDSFSTMPLAPFYNVSVQSRITGTFLQVIKVGSFQNPYKASNGIDIFKQGHTSVDYTLDADSGENTFVEPSSLQIDFSEDNVSTVHQIGGDNYILTTNGSGFVYAKEGWRINNFIRRIHRKSRFFQFSSQKITIVFAGPPEIPNTFESDRVNVMAPNDPNKALQFARDTTLGKVFRSAERVGSVWQAGTTWVDPTPGVVIFWADFLGGLNGSESSGVWEIWSVRNDIIPEKRIKKTRYDTNTGSVTILQEYTFGETAFIGTDASLNFPQKVVVLKEEASRILIAHGGSPDTPTKFGITPKIYWLDKESKNLTLVADLGDNFVFHLWTTDRRNNNIVYDPETESVIFFTGTTEAVDSDGEILLQTNRFPDPAKQVLEVMRYYL